MRVSFFGTLSSNVQLIIKGKSFLVNFPEILLHKTDQTSVHAVSTFSSSSKPKGSKSVGLMSIKLGMYIVWVVGKSSS